VGGIPQSDPRAPHKGRPVPADIVTDLERLAQLIRTRNAVDEEIAAVIGRPALAGHIGEYVAARVFDIDLEASAARKAIDGRFRSGPLAGASVNIKCYAKLEGLLDLAPSSPPDYYLVLVGPRSAAASSRGGMRPWLIHSVFLFDANRLLHQLGLRGVKVGIATSVARQLWDEAAVYPAQQNMDLVLSETQRRTLGLFA
jgi:hypothetical protein